MYDQRIIEYLVSTVKHQQDQQANAAQVFQKYPDNTQVRQSSRLNLDYTPCAIFSNNTSTSTGNSGATGKSGRDKGANDRTKRKQR